MSDLHDTFESLQPRRTMTLRKRLRMLYAALTQEWHLETCETCGATWWADVRALPALKWCVSCESTYFEQWKDDYEARHEIGQKRSA